MKLDIKKVQSREGEQGNVLFLILIAVALFAALSYAVTQSSRSGGSDAGKETNLINSSQLIQYPSSVRTAIVRMIIGGVGATSLDFMSATNAEYGDEDTYSHRIKVFHPEGGGATYIPAPADIMRGTGQGQWVFNGENQIDLVGTTEAAGPTASTADVIAFLSDVTVEMCNKINEELSVGTVGTPPTETGIDVITNMEEAAGMGAGGGTIGDAAGSHDLDSQPYGCFTQGSTWIYYHVLVER